MAFEIEVISREVITPSSPTPDHLNKLNLSYIDQFSPSRLLPLVLFYPAVAVVASSSSISNSERVKHIKNSLSKALTKFYPLAGRVDSNNNTYINCNDKGVVFLEAQASCTLLNVINDPIPSQFSNFFIPLESESEYESDDSKELYCMIVQTTSFSCGGMAVGVAISHKLVDGSSFFTFVKNWASISRENDQSHIISPQFISSTLFPPRDLGGFNTDNSLSKKQDIVTKRFVFTASSIAALRYKYTKDELSIPSRIEALSAFIWTRFMVSTNQVKNNDATGAPTKIYLLVNVVNLRTRADPPFPDCYFGNMYWPAITLPPYGDDKETGFVIAEKVRESIRGIDAAYVKELRERNEQLNIMMNKQKDALKGEMIPFSFSSLCRFPLYEADFGWGKPIWVGTGTIGLKNLVTFLDSLSGDGIEAWIDLSIEDMARFETDQELLSYVSTSGHDASFSPAL